MVNPYIVVRDFNYKSTSDSSRNLDTLRADTGRRMICIDHGYFDPSKVDSSAWLHFLEEGSWNLAEQLVIRADLGGADNLPILFLSSHDKEWSVHRGV